MSDENRTVPIPYDVAQKLAPMLATLGVVSDPDFPRIAPVIDPSMPIRQLALELGQMLSRQNLFLRGDAIVTVDVETGKTEAMSAKRFTGWVEEFVAVRSNGRSQRLRDSLTREDADQVLSQDIFRCCLRPLNGVHKMRMPVFRADGAIEFLKPGYDAPSGIYTIETIKYPMDWTIEAAMEYLNSHAEDYPWAWVGEPGDLATNRSWSVQLFAMLGTYCRALFPPGTTRPLVTYIGNQPGTGKSMLVAMGLMPVFGAATTTGCPKNDEDMAKVLETTARTRQPYLFLDDVRFGLDSTPLNRFLTDESHGGRVMGGNSAVFDEPAITQVFATGNGLKVTQDLMRRGLIVELFLPGEVRGRKFRRRITMQYLKLEETRQSFLAALNAIVRLYIEEVKERPIEEHRHESPLESFEEFSGVIGQMVRFLGMADPLQAPEIAANEDDDEMRELLVIAATGEPCDYTFDRKALVLIARANGLLESLVGSKDDAEMDSKATKRWGRQLQTWRGRELVDQKGRRFQFGSKRQKRGATYPLKFIGVPSTALEPTAAAPDKPDELDY